MKVEHNGSSISVKGESRITPLGAKLRQYKLDELPELWNVLKGGHKSLYKFDLNQFISGMGVPYVPSEGQQFNNDIYV